MDKELLISKYFTGELSAEEQQTFDRFLDDDRDFRAEVDFQKKVRLAVIHAKQAEKKARLQSIEAGIKTSQSSRKWWLAAASILILLTAGFFFLTNEASSEQLFANYYEPAKNIIHPIVRNGDDPSKLTEAFLAYQKNEFELAGQLLTEEYESTNRSELIFYRAICQIETGQTDLAIKNLISHQEYKDVMSDKTGWYLALAYLKTDKKAEAKAVLEEIVNNTGSFKLKEAKSLLKKL